MMMLGGISPSEKVLGPAALHEASQLTEFSPYVSLQEHLDFQHEADVTKAVPWWPRLMRTNGSGFLSRKMGPVHLCSEAAGGWTSVRGTWWFFYICRIIMCCR